MRLVFFALAAFALISLGGCSTFLMKDCEQQGNSNYYHCKLARTQF